MTVKIEFSPDIDNALDENDTGETDCCTLLDTVRPKRHQSGRIRWRIRPFLDWKAAGCSR